MKLAAAIALLGAVALLAVVALPTASACRCLRSTLREQLTADDVVQHKPLSMLVTGDGWRRLTVTQVTEVYNGCLRVGDLVEISTATSSAACGVQFEIGVEYISALSRVSMNNETQLKEAHTSSCMLNTHAEYLLGDEQAARLLETRPVMCEGNFVGCAKGVRPVQCFADPCMYSRCGSAGAKCVSNYCGGCLAEFFLEDGRPTCYPCENGSCGRLHTCDSSNTCVIEAAAPADMSLF